MQWLKSYLPLVDGPYADLRAAHRHPSARAKINDDPPFNINRPSYKSDRLPIQVDTVLHRAWAINDMGRESVHPKQTVLVD
jgi:hypothetical protein